MKNKKHTLLECLFGHHTYTKESVMDEDGDFVHLCQVCKRSGYKEYPDGSKIWYDYDKEGHCFCVRWDDGEEHYLNKKGSCTYIKFNDGTVWGKKE